MNLLTAPEEEPPYPQHPPRRPPVWSRLLAGIALGFLLGNLFMLLAAAGRIEDLQLAKQQLTRDLEKANAHIAGLEKDARQRQPPRVQQVTVLLEGVDDRATRQQLEEELDGVASTLQGKAVSEINPVVAASIFDERIVEVKSGRFLLHLRWLIVGPDMRLLLRAEEMP